MKQPHDPAAKIAGLEAEIARLKSAVGELNVLNEIALAATSALEVEPLLNLLVEKSVQAVRAEEGAIKLLVGQKENAFQTLIRKKHRTGLLDLRLGMHITGWVLKHRQPLLISHLADDTRFQPTEAEKQQISSLICAPIFSKAKVLGILTLINKTDGARFSENDLRLLTIIASQAGQLIHNRQLQAEAREKQRMAHELELARNIQQDLIPRQAPEIPGVQIASFLETTDRVGGDYYDFFEIGSGRLGVVIADVSGHGPAAALIMTMVKGILHAITRRFRSADQTLAELNAVLSAIAPPEIFVTMMFLVLDPRQKLLQYANAGHNPLVYFDSRAQAVTLPRFYSPALNLSPASVYHQREMPLQEKDCILIYTDGITERFNGAGEMFAETGLRTVFREAVAFEPVLIIGQIRKALQDFAGDTPPQDDMAMIALKINAPLAT